MVLLVMKVEQSIAMKETGYLSVACHQQLLHLYATNWDTTTLVRNTILAYCFIKNISIRW